MADHVGHGEIDGVGDAVPVASPGDPRHGWLQEAARQIAIVVGLIGILITTETYIIRTLGADLVTSVLVAGLIYTVLFSTSVPVIRWRLSGYCPARSISRWTPTVMALWFGLHGTLAWLAMPWVGVRLAVTVGGLSVVPGYAVSRRAVDALLAGSMDGLARLYDSKDAEVMVAACRRRLRDRKVQGRQRTQVTVNLAHALISQSTLRGKPDGLLEATTLLADVVRKEQVAASVVLRATEELTRAMGAKDRKHGDRKGWSDAVELWATASRRLAGDRMSVAELFATSARQTELARAAESESEATWHRSAAIDRCREALDLCPPEWSFRREIQTHLVHLMTADPAASDVEIDEAVTVSRSLYDRSIEEAGLTRGLHAKLGISASLDAGVFLAANLYGRACRTGFPAERDTREAIGLCWQALDCKDPRPDAGPVLARTLVLRESLGLPAEFDLPGIPPGSLPPVSTAFRLALDIQKESVDGETQAVALDWAEWAIEHDQPNDASDALWYLVTSVSTETMRRLTRSGREDVVGLTQGVASEAGYWLSRVGRQRDAVVAVEHSRAVMFAGPTRGIDPGLQKALAMAGRGDLWLRWLRTTAGLDAAYRAQYADDGAITSSFGAAVTTLPQFVSAEQVAWSDYDRLIHEIGGVLGSGPERTSRISPYETLQQLVGDDLVVYIASAQRGGYALVVDGPLDPVVIELPMLVADDLDEWIMRWAKARSRPGAWPAVLCEVLAWLAEAVNRPLLHVLAAGREMTVVPVGLLGLLPLHATPWPADRRQTSVDPWPFNIRYSPNARIAAAARNTASRTDYATPQVVAVSAPKVAGWPSLMATSLETRRLAELHGDSCLLLDDAAKAVVADALPEATVWHFACHGIADLEHPLESSVILTDGRLTLREILGRSPTDHRLAVLSACETSVPDLDLLDEVMSFPAGLLYAGVAGVVASQWAVDDRAAALLMSRFHNYLRSGHPPVHALSEAQAWLRDATNNEFHATYPDLVSEPVRLPPAALASWCRQQPYRAPHHWAAFSLTGV